MIKCLKYFLLAATAILVVLLVLGFVYLMSWPWWVGIFLVICLIGLFIGMLFLKKLLLRRKEQQFVQQVIQQDNDRLTTLSSAEQNQMKELQDRWKEAVETLRNSHLKKQGNPLYVLPWYLVMGESGSGKTTAITSARISSPFAEVHHTSGVSGTKNCDWWFFDQAVIIDTAGRYAMPVDSGRDNDEWQKFLSLLVKYRKREPIHGLIVTVSADKLLKGNPELLENDGKQMRRRMDELMRVLGIKFPVYLLVTKCDLVQGMTQFSERLPEKSLDQPLGVINQDLGTDVHGFVDRAVSLIADRLKNLRTLMLHQNDQGPVGAGVLLFPDEAQVLKPGLDVFMKAAFLENRFQETPLLRGIYLCSGRQEGTPYSHFLNELGLISEREVLPGTSKGLFLHDFFEKILPRDRGLFAPTTRSKEWQSLTRNLGLTSWVLLGIALSGLLSYAFVKNMATIREATGVIAKSPALKGETLTDLVTMDGFRKMILNVEQRNRNWLIPRFGLTESVQVEKALKAKYCKQFQDRFLAQPDKEMSGAIAGFSVATPDEVVAPYIVHLVRRINLLKGRLAGIDFNALQAKPLPTYILASKPQDEDSEITKKFGSMYVNYLMWRSDSQEISREILELQVWLRQVITVKGANLHWLLGWANRQGLAPSLTLQSFWGGSRALPDDVTIPSVFTRKGKEIVTAFENELLAAYPEQALLEKEKGNFESWYRGSCFAAWQRFVDVFPKGEERLNGAKEWQAAAGIMATEQGPYTSLMNKMVSELEPFGVTDGAPVWLQQVFKYRLLKSAGGATGAATQAVDQGKKIAGQVGQLFGKSAPAVSTAETQIAAAKAIQEYQGAIAAIAPAAKSRTESFKLALQVFTEDSVTSKSPFYVAVDASQRMKDFIGGGRVDETFGRLLTGPITFFWTYVRMEAACSLQSQWEEKVLKEAQGTADQQTLQYLLGKEGPVWKFVSTTSDPFMGWNPQRGYYAKVALGGAIPFEPSFFAFLAKGAKVKVAAAPVKQNNTVTLRGLPTDANPEARTKPQSTRLELQCASGPLVMENLNYPVSKTFIWSPDSCGDVVFQIDIGDLILTKRYSGSHGFPDFLHDFPGGRHIFTPHDFPKEKQSLERMGIKFIRVNYAISGGIDLGGQGKDVPGQVPRKITQCWD